MISELRQLDLPAPVAPAMSTWGMAARFIMMERPLMSRPIPTSSGWEARRASSLTRMSPSATIWRRALGTSTPMACLPGMGARMRTSGVAMA